MVLDKMDGFTVDFHNMGQEYFCVMDVYPVDNPSHPRRHPGWFRFDVKTDGTYHFKIKEENGTYTIVSDDDLKVIDSWQSDNLEKDILPFSVRVVIRKKVNNEIVFEDRLICFADETMFCQQKSVFENMQLSIKSLPIINQIIPSKLNVKIVLRSFVDGDAIGYYAWESYSLLKKLGVDVEIYVQTCDDKFRPFVHHVQELFEDNADVNNKTVILYNYSIKDDYLDLLLELPCKKIAYFHGITNPTKLRVFDAELAEECRKGLDELHNIVDFDLVVVNSNCTKRNLVNAVENNGKTKISEELEKDGLSSTSVSKEFLLELTDEYITTPLKKLKKKIKVAPPVLISSSSWEAVEADGQFSKSIEKIGDVLIFVGRMYPHKRIEDVLDVFQELLEQNDNAVLLLIGGTHNSYHKYLDYKIKQLPKKCQERILSFPQVSRNQLKAAYQSAKAFITMSEDEGFCVPVLESMRFHLPVIAKMNEHSAAHEVLGDTGKLVQNKDYESVAAEINHIMVDSEYSRRIADGQDVRFQDFSDEKLMGQFLHNLLECYYGETESMY